MTQPLHLTPGQLRAGDRVLVNEAFWDVKAVGAHCRDDSHDDVGWYKIRLAAGADHLEVKRAGDTSLTVMRYEVRDAS